MTLPMKDDFDISEKRRTSSKYGVRNTPGPYERYVTSLCDRYSNLRVLSNFLGLESQLEQSRISCLDFFESGHVSPHSSIDLSSLSDFLREGQNDNDSLKGQILFVEDLTRPLIEILGSNLNVDPAFFALHLRQSIVNGGTSRKIPLLLPSASEKKNFACIDYIHTLSFDDGSIPDSTKLRCRSNVPRFLSPAKGIISIAGEACVGTMHRCITVLKTRKTCGTWLGIILVDPPMGNSFLSTEKGNNSCGLVDIPVPSLFHGGYVDFSDYPRFSDLRGTLETEGPKKLSAFDDLIFYWTNALPPGFSLDDPALHSLTHFPLQIAAGELMTATIFVHHLAEAYSRLLGNRGAELTALETDLRHIYKWRRRTSAYEELSRQLASMCTPHEFSLEHPESAESTTTNPLARDFIFISRLFAQLASQLAGMLPLITSLVQIMDSRKSLQETSNLSRLTYLALFFVPLSFTAGLFSMSGSMAPGAPHFWIYFAVSIPLVLLTFAVTAYTKWGSLLKGAWSSATKPVKKKVK